jgi:hypothetical protein
VADPKAGWRSIRAQRSDPPALAAEHEARRRVFQAALAQAEELWDAAAAVGTASRPLPLYYCLSQAGRAVCAAWLRDDPWQPRSHGLARVESADADLGLRALGYGARVTRREAPAYSMIAQATVSETFDGTATVAELWASLPSFPMLPPQISGPRCIRLERVSPPPAYGSSLQRALALTHGVFHLYGADLRYDDLPNTYPTLRGLEQDGVAPGLTPEAEGEPIFTFPREDRTLRSLYDVAVRDPDDDRRRQFFVRPVIGTNRGVEPPSRFLTLYALMFCLSELARYYPDTWVAALDPDDSTLDGGIAGRNPLGKGLASRLRSHASGRRSGDQFCVYVADHYVLPDLSGDQIEAIRDSRLSMDSLVRERIHTTFAFRFIAVADYATALQVESAIKSGRLSVGPPRLNPSRRRLATAP